MVRQDWVKRALQDCMTGAGHWGRFGLDLVLRVVFPPTCAGCDVAESWMCRFCRQELVEIRSVPHCPRCCEVFDQTTPVHSCPRCRSWLSRTLHVRSRYVFDGPVRRAVHLTKYQGQRARAEWVAREIVGLIRDQGAEFDIIAPVPLGPERRKRRGFNQSEEVARRLADTMRTSYQDILVRVRETPPQVGLGAVDRRRNVQDAFSVAGDVADLSILLVDDVVTTGSTLDACALTLERAGVRRVTAVTLASESGGTVFPDEAPGT